MIPILEEAGVAVAPVDDEQNFKVDFSKDTVCCQPTGVAGVCPGKINGIP